MLNRTRLGILSTIAVLLGFVTWSADAQEISFPPKPPPEHFYVDEAGLIAPNEGQAIDDIAKALLDGERVALIVVTITSLADHNAAGYTIERYAFQLFNHWGVGSQYRNYGMLLLVSKGDRKARIELGAAWGQSHNTLAQQVMDTLIIPLFKNGQFSEGILAGVRGMDAMARGLALPKPQMHWGFIIGVVVFFVVGIAVAISLFKSGRTGWGWAVIALLVAVFLLLLRIAAINRGSGGAFQGGSSGGGGATGSW